MNITLITGQSQADLKGYITNMHDIVYQYPESKPCHPVKLHQAIQLYLTEHYENDEDVFIATYSDVVFDSVRVWVTRNDFENTKVIMLTNDNSIVSGTIDSDGNVSHYLPEVNTIKVSLLKELYDIRRLKCTRYNRMSSI